MSEPNSNENSRSSSPAGLAPGGERSRAVSGSLKDRIAKFNNPDAAPLAPKHPFGYSGPSGSANAPQRGLYGNRIPSLDPRFSGHLAGLGAPPGRKVSESKGLIGNRIPSSTPVASAQGPLSGNNTGSSGRNSPAPVPAPAGSVPAPKITEARPASPEGSVNSSTASNALGTGSPATSRSSSPPTSPGGGLPPSLVIATHPDGGPGAMTPSSTRAEAGDTTELSAPSTPIVGAQAESLPAPQYDLVPHNLKLAAGMHRALSSTSGARSFAPSITSSLASQYDSQGNEEKQMMQDVSGISTPTGTPRAANRELDESTRGEGSVAGGSEMGDHDLSEVKRRLDLLGVDDEKEAGERIDRDPTPEPAPVTADTTGDSTATEIDSVGPDVEEYPDVARSGDAEKAVGGTKNVEARDDAVASGEPAHQTHKDNPNKADDLDALKAGELNEEHDHDPSYGDRPLPVKANNPINSLAEMGFLQNLVEKEVPSWEQKEQKGSAGQRMEDIERPDEIIQPASSAGDASAGPESLKVEEASAVSDAPESREVEMEHAAGQEEAAELATKTKEASEKKDAPSKSERDAAAGKDKQDLGAGDYVNMNETFGMREPAAQPSNAQEKREVGGEGEESGSEGETDKPPKVHGTLGGTEHTEHVGPDEPSVLERIGVGQSAEADGRRERIEEGFAENGLLDYPSQEDQLEDQKTRDQRDGKTLVGELQKMAQESTEEGEEAPQEKEKDEDARPSGMSVPNPFKDSGKSHGPATASIAPRPKSPGHGVLDTDAKDEDPILMSGTTDLDAPAKEPEKKPLQIQIEPAPIAQPPDAKADKEDTSHTLDSSPERIKSPEDTEAEARRPTPQLPSPPANEPDELDPPRSARSIGGGISSGQSTPIDPHFLKSFPLVPDEDRPRIEVHLSPHATPFVPRFPLPRTNSGSTPTSPNVASTPGVPSPVTLGGDQAEAKRKEKAENEVTQGSAALGPAGESQAEARSEADQTAGSGLGSKTDLADVPSVPMPNLDDAVSAASKGQVPSLVPNTPPSPSKMHQPNLPAVEGKNYVDSALDQGEEAAPSANLPDVGSAPKDKRAEGIKESRSYSNSSLDVSDGEQGVAGKAKKRLSRQAPKSPMLDDEDPGDWTPGEDGWAVVTKGRDS